MNKKNPNHIKSLIADLTKISEASKLYRQEFEKITSKHITITEDSFKIFSKKIHEKLEKLKINKSLGNLIEILFELFYEERMYNIKYQVIHRSISECSDKLADFVHPITSLKVYDPDKIKRSSYDLDEIIDDLLKVLEYEDELSSSVISLVFNMYVCFLSAKGKEKRKIQKTIIENIKDKKIPLTTIKLLLPDPEFIKLIQGYQKAKKIRNYNKASVEFFYESFKKQITRTNIQSTIQSLIGGKKIPKKILELK